MAKLIFLTGFSGCGKTTVAEKFPAALRLDGDHLFSSSLLELRPDLDKSLKNSWSEWPHVERTATTATLVFRVTLGREFPRLLDDRGHIIADGAIFNFGWFREGLVTMLAEIGYVFEHTHLLYLNLPDEELLRSIRARAQADPRRAHELKQYTNVAAVAKSTKGFKNALEPAIWEELDSRHELEDRLRGLLNG